MSTNSQSKVIAVNRKATHDYEILERVEAGLVLTGTEIKSIRAGRANLREARKLLLHRDQLAHLKISASQKGLTILPLRLYIRNHVAKVELGLARGRRQYDKRKVIARRDADRAMEQAIRRRR